MPNNNNQTLTWTITSSSNTWSLGTSGSGQLGNPQPLPPLTNPFEAEANVWMDAPKPRKRKAVTPQEGPVEEFYNQRLGRHFSFNGNRPKGLIGLEIEVEGKNLFQTPFAYWTCHQDGSLRETDGHPAVEYVLKEPVSIDDLIKALDYLNVKLKETGSKVVLSNRTSVHVHFNCQKYTVRDLYNFILLYIVFEEILVEWSGPERAGNLFCLRAKDSEFFITMLESVFKTKNFREWSENMRYTACNVASIPKFGSLEFRSLKGTIDKNMILNWVLLLDNLRLKAQKYDNPTQIVEEFHRIGPLPFFKMIFNNQKLFDLLKDIPQLSAKLWSGLRLMRDVAYACEWNPPLTKKKGLIEEEPDDPEPVISSFHQNGVANNPTFQYTSPVPAGTRVSIRGVMRNISNIYSPNQTHWQGRNIDNNGHLGPVYVLQQPANTTMYYIQDIDIDQIEGTGAWISFGYIQGDHRW